MKAFGMAVIILLSLSVSLGAIPAAADTDSEPPCEGEYHHIVAGSLETKATQTSGSSIVNIKFESKQLEKIYGVDTIFSNHTLDPIGDSDFEHTEVVHGYKMCVIKGEDAPKEWSHGFSWPQWNYYRYILCGRTCTVWFERADPINVGLGWTSFPRTGLIYGLRDHLLSVGYTDTSGCSLTQYVYDEGAGQLRAHDVTLQMHGDCSSNTRYHNRMWALSNGYDAVSEHFEHLHWLPYPYHHVHSYEDEEEHLALHASTKSCYWVREDYYWLDNYLSDPYNNGYATAIYFLSGC